VLLRALASRSSPAAGAATIALAAVVAWGAASNAGATAENAAAEFAHVRARLLPLAQRTSPPPAQIDVVLPPQFAVFSARPLALDLRYNASNYSGFQDGIVHGVTRELGIPEESYRLRICNGDAMPGECSTPADIVIDLQSLVKGRGG
jgi:hypothetical protein